MLEAYSQVYCKYFFILVITYYFKTINLRWNDEFMLQLYTISNAWIVSNYNNVPFNGGKLKVVAFWL